MPFEFQIKSVQIPRNACFVFLAASCSMSICTLDSMIQPIFFPLNVNSSSISLKNLANYWENKKNRIYKNKAKKYEKKRKKNDILLRVISKITFIALLCTYMYIILKIINLFISLNF